MLVDMVVDMINLDFEICKRFALEFVQIYVKKGLVCLSGIAQSCELSLFLSIFDIDSGFIT